MRSGRGSSHPFRTGHRKGWPLVRSSCGNRGDRLQVPDRYSVGSPAGEVRQLARCLQPAAHVGRRRHLGAGVHRPGGPGRCGRGPTGPSRSAPRSCGPISTRPGHEKRVPVGEPGNDAIGRSRGGLTTKIHLAADARCQPLAFVLTAGQGHGPPTRSPSARTASHQAGPGPGRQGVLLPRDPRAPVRARNPGSGLRPRRPAQSPDTSRQPRRQATGLRSATPDEIGKRNRLGPVPASCSDPESDCCDGDGAVEGIGALIESGGHGAGVLERQDGPFHVLPALVDRRVEAGGPSAVAAAALAVGSLVLRLGRCA